MIKSLGTFQKNPQQVAQVYVGHFLIKFTKEPCDFFQKCTWWVPWWVLFKCDHQVTAGHIGDQSDGYFSKVITKYPLGDGWALLSRNHKELTKYPLGMWGSAPSVTKRGTLNHNVLDMWAPDQIWTQYQIESRRNGFAQEWPSWADHMIQATHHPDGLSMTGGRAFMGSVLLSNEVRRRAATVERRLDSR